jgi:hypothetical protein
MEWLIKVDMVDHKKYLQIDLTPTLSALLEIPIQWNNLETGTLKKSRSNQHKSHIFIMTKRTKNRERRI